MKGLIIIIAVLVILSPVIGIYFAFAYSGIMHALARWQDGAMSDVPNTYIEE